MPQKGVKTVAQNRRARHDYFVLETWEAGIELRGTEVKSIRLGKCALKDCYAAVKNGELFVYGISALTKREASPIPTRCGPRSC